jgi:hypothetical protein
MILVKCLTVHDNMLMYKLSGNTKFIFEGNGVMSAGYDQKEREREREKINSQHEFNQR